MLSYLMLFCLGVFSYAIVMLEQNFVLAQIGLILFVVGNIGQLIGYKKRRAASLSSRRILNSC